jgi:hypothetical protein
MPRVRAGDAEGIPAEGAGYLAGLVGDGGAGIVPVAPVPELPDGVGVGPSAADTGGDGEPGDLALDFLKADSVSRGYDCVKPGCRRCGKHFADYCRRYGIMGPAMERAIRAHEWSLFGEDSTWDSE